jgi:hypothetical protein
VGAHGSRMARAEAWNRADGRQLWGDVPRFGLRVARLVERAFRSASPMRAALRLGRLDAATHRFLPAWLRAGADNLIGARRDPVPGATCWSGARVAAMRSQVTASRWGTGYEAPVICTPEEPDL